MTSERIDCEQALARLFDFLDHELDDTEREAMQQHLSTCRSCFSRAHFEQRLKAQLQALRQDEVDAPVRQRIERLLRSF